MTPLVCALIISTSDFQSEVGEVFGEIGGELLAKFGRRFSSFFCWGKSSEAFSTKTPPQISPSNFTTRFWVVAGPIIRLCLRLCQRLSIPSCGPLCMVCQGRQLYVGPSGVPYYFPHLSKKTKKKLCTNLQHGWQHRTHAGGNHGTNDLFLERKELGPHSDPFASDPICPALKDSYMT